MKQSLYISTEPAFYKIVITSAVLHVLLIIFITVPVRTKEMEYKTYFVDLVGPSAVHRPVKTAPVKKTVPSKTIEDKSPPKAEKAIRKESIPLKKAVPKKGVSLEPDKSAETVSREIERLRALKALSIKKKEKEEKLEKDQRDSEEVARAIEIIRKNKQEDITKGAGMSGTQGTGIQPPEYINNYGSTIKGSIEDQWIYPEFDSDGIEAVLSFKIDKKGNIISPKIVKSSGNVLFDRSAMKAVMKASPLPPPPLGMDDEFILRFHL
ncbi:MAG: TonB family protein [Nitrospirota bacterium]